MTTFEIFQTQVTNPSKEKMNVIQKFKADGGLEFPSDLFPSYEALSRTEGLVLYRNMIERMATKRASEVEKEEKDRKLEHDRVEAVTNANPLNCLRYAVYDYIESYNASKGKGKGAAGATDGKNGPSSSSQCPEPPRVPGVRYDRLFHEGGQSLPTVLEDARHALENAASRTSAAAGGGSSGGKQRRWTKAQLAARKVRGEVHSPGGAQGENPRNGKNKANGKG